MKTAAEMRSFSEKYSLVKNFLLGIKLDKCAFEEVESALKPDEEVLFCVGTYFKQVLALTNQRIILASKRDMVNNISQGIKFYAYENINSVSWKSYTININTIGDDDLALGNFRQDTIAEAVSIMEEIIRNYQKQQTEPTTQIVQQTSAADELKKFKELLDMGVITQEEFDAKKKQLLGL